MRRELRIAGFKLTMDPLLPVVILLIGWMLTQRYIPGQSFLLGGLASLLLTFSILFHEIGHAVVAQRLNLSIERIHLFLFGGMAELKTRPSTAGHEALVALAGPFASLLLGCMAWVIGYLLPPYWFTAGIMAAFLSQMNLLLALFNLIPIFPLDGGRALRALFWKWSGRYVKASVWMHQVSYVLIIIVLVLALIDGLVLKSNYTLLLFVLTGYLAYTVFTGRRELLAVPKLSELIFEPDSYTAIAQSRKNVVIPVMDSEMRLTAIVMPDGKESIIPQIGMYIDMEDSETWSHVTPFEADFVPVMRSGIVIGIADANELRFWLKEHHHAVV